jgi:hypothetical protein
LQGIACDAVGVVGIGLLLFFVVGCFLSWSAIRKFIKIKLLKLFKQPEK